MKRTSLIFHTSHLFNHVFDPVKRNGNLIHPLYPIKYSPQTVRHFRTDLPRKHMYIKSSSALLRSLHLVSLEFLSRTKRKAAKREKKRKEKEQLS